MTAPAINGTKYPQPVDKLLPAAREIVKELGEVPARNELMRRFRIGAPKAGELRDLLIAERAREIATRDPESGWTMSNDVEVLRLAVDLATERGKMPTTDELADLFRLAPERADLLNALVGLAIERRANGLPVDIDQAAVDPTVDPYDYATPIGPDPLPAPVVPESVPLVEPGPTPVVTPVVAEPVEQVAPVSHPGTPAPLGPPPALSRGERRALREQAAHDALMQGQTRRVREWTAKAAEARQLRRLLMDPDIQAVRLMRQRARWTAMAWSALLFALAFTMVNVQRFAAGHAEAWSPTWLVAWLVDPAFSILLVGLLIARGQLSAVGRSVHQRTVRRVEYALLASTAAMNVMPTLAEGYPGGWREQAMQVLLHLLIPGLAFASALVITLIQDHFAAAITAITEGEATR